MQTRLSRRILAPALLAMAIAPLALTATAAPGDAERAEQRQQWQEARAERYAEKRAALFERAGLDAETREALENAHREHRQAMAELREEHRDRIDELLSDDQQAALDEARREMREEYRTQKRQSHAKALQQRMTEMVDGWDLSEEEREALGELRRAHYADMAELRNRDFDSRQERREAYQALRDEHQAALAELLSEEQIEEMQQAVRKAYGSRAGNGNGNGNGKN
ncbi:hypothetical protein LWH48_16305 [Halomonas sp. G15]|uniref:hypothetical protein n=1 Tax=Halomonas sp. G15 TaxID=2903521 RepID=UPI001E2915BC|nr:hypothetical protein [Halomonas sp. G15]MCE0734328.1 hypothetical protein [Halomonas sp. G15]